MTSTIAARCAAMSSAIAQIVLDANHFARQLRQSRHYVNSVNADLLAIKLSLDIARDDFSIPRSRSSLLPVEAMAGLLDCCCRTAENLHKPIIRLSAIKKRREDWDSFLEGNSQGIRQELEALRLALDLVLDFAVLVSNHENCHSACRPSKNSCVSEWLPDSGDLFLKKIDIKRQHITALTEDRLPNLYDSVDKLRASVNVLLDESFTKRTEKRPDSRSDSLEPDIENELRLHASEANTSHYPSTLTASNNIDAWIASVLHQSSNSNTLQTDVFTLDSRTNMQPKGQEHKQDRDREERIPSRGTFYSESTSSGTPNQSPGLPKSPKSGNHRTDSPLLDNEDTISRPKRLTQCTTTTEVSIIHQNLTNDKIAIARGRRKQLSRSQRAAVDRKLHEIPSTATVVSVECIFFEGADPNASHPKFGTVAIRAAYELPADVLRLLFDYGADITKTAKTRFYSTLHAAVLGRNLETLKYLLSFSNSTSRFSIEPIPPTPDTPKFSFPTSSHIIFNVDTPNAHGETPLHIAARTPGAYDIAKYLLERGADVNREVPNGGGSPLQIAVSGLDSRERSAMVELLMAYGAEGIVEGESARNIIRGERRGKGLSVLGLI